MASKIIRNLFELNLMRRGFPVWLHRYLHAPHHHRACVIQLLNCCKHMNNLRQVTSRTQLFQIRNFSTSAQRNSDSANKSSNSVQQSQDRLMATPSEWKESFQMPEPELDWDYLLNKDNSEEIHRNVHNRKGVGDIYKVISLHESYCQETDENKKEHLKQQMVAAALQLPNASHPQTVIGDESCARLVETVGEKKDFDFKPRNVSELAGRGLQMLREQKMNFASGFKTYFLESDLARLERALVTYTVDQLLGKGFEVIAVPDLLYPGVINGCGFNTDVHTSQVYRLHPECLNGACLAGTAEMSLAGYFMNEELHLSDLPKRVAAVSRCYRAEADTKAVERGLYRMHHFTKVEMFGLTANEDGTESDQLLQEFLTIERELFSSLGIYFRILDMPSQELGGPAYRKYDIESWMYGKNIWGEISSCSNCTDYQSRRLNIKYKASDGYIRHVHTVNGTACAVPRMITTLLEQNQGKSRKLPLPEVLYSYMGGQTHLAFNPKKLPYTFIRSLKQTSN